MSLILGSHFESLMFHTGGAGGDLIAKPSVCL